MKHVKFSTTEEIFSYLKNKIGFDNLEPYLNEMIKSEMERKNDKHIRVH